MKISLKLFKNIFDKYILDYPMNRSLKPSCSVQTYPLIKLLTMMDQQEDEDYDNNFFEFIRLIITRKASTRIFQTY